MTAKVTVTHAKVYRSTDGQWRWRSMARNHRIIASGEGYEDKGDAMAACVASIPEGTPIEVVGEPEQ